jgi:hypothetical protein
MRTPNNPLNRLMSCGAGSYGDFAVASVCADALLLATADADYRWMALSSERRRRSSTLFPSQGIVVIYRVELLHLACAEAKLIMIMVNLTVPILPRRSGTMR